MPRNITVTFADGTQHTYANAPDDITPDQVTERAQKEFGQPVKSLDGGAGGDPNHPPVAEVGDDGKLVVNIVGEKSEPQPQPERSPLIDYALNASGPAGMGIKAAMDAQPPAGDDGRPISQTQGFVEGIEKPFNNAATFLENGLNLLPGGNGVGLGDRIQSIGPSIGADPSAQATIDAQTQARANSGYQSGGLGKLAGEVTGVAMLSRLPGGAISQGAQGGALLSENPNDLFGVGRDALIGGATSGLLNLGLRGAGALANPSVSPEMRTLIDAGVKPTTGQAFRSMGTKAGNIIARTEDLATSAPGVGGAIIDARNDTLDQFARATINRSVGPIGLKLPDSISLGTTRGARSAVQWAGDKLSDAYDAIKPKIRIQANDPEFLDGLSTIRDDLVSGMHPDRIKQYDNILKGLGRFWDEGTELSGQAYKDVESRLTRNINQFARGDGDQQQLSQALEGVRDQLQGLAARQNPSVAKELSALNQGWKSLTQVERAASTSKGLPTPAGYSQAVKMSSDTVRRRGYARGEALNQDLSDAASDILPSEVADSGTAARLAGQSPWRALLGYAGAVGYRGAQGLTPTMLRQTRVSPEVQRLLQYGAKATPYVAPALEQQAR